MSFEKIMIKSERIQYNWTLGTYRYTRYDLSNHLSFDTERSSNLKAHYINFFNKKIYVQEHFKYKTEVLLFLLN